MGRLIKNHWGRLIILTASACTRPTQFTAHEQALTRFQYRPDRERNRRLYLAQSLLGLHLQEPGRRRRPDPRPPDPQLNNGPRRSSLGMATKATSGIFTTSQHRNPTHHIPTQRSTCGPALSGHRPCDILPDRYWGVLLGLQRRRGMLEIPIQTLSLANLIYRLYVRSLGHYQRDQGC